MNVERLQPGRWGELARAFAAGRSDEPLPDRRHGVVYAATEGERVVAVLGMEKVWCATGLLVAPEFRGRGLPQVLIERLAADNTESLAEMCVTTNRHVELMVYGLGFKPLEGVLWRRER